MRGRAELQPAATRRVIAKKALSADAPLKLDMVNRELVASNDGSKK
jgi:type VI secretion system protein VasD